MADKLRFKRGQQSTLAGITPEIGEPVWDYSRSRLSVGDGVTPGGILVGPTSGQRFKREGGWYKDAGSAVTTVSSVGIVAPTLDGISGAVDVAGANGQPLLEHITSGTGTACGVIGNPFMSIDWALEVYIGMRAPAAVANIRLWAGFVGGSPDAVTDPGTLHMATLWYDASAHSGATWRAVCSNGAGSGVYTEVDTGVAISGGSYHLWWIETTRDTEPVRFYHNGVRVAEISTNQPASNNLLTPCHRAVQLSTTTRRCRWGRIVIAHR